MSNTLPSDSTARNEIPLNDGFFAYFPAAIAGCARWSKIGNDKHNAGEPLHHARDKSTDHANKVLRHVMDINDFLASSQRTGLTAEEVRLMLDDADALVWRACALSQQLHECFDAAPLAPNAR